MEMPGPGTVFLSQNWKFTAPVFIGDTITAEAEILSIHENKPVTQLKIQVTREGEETVLEGEAWCYTFSGREHLRGRSSSERTDLRIRTSRTRRESGTGPGFDGCLPDFLNMVFRNRSRA